MKEIKKIDVSIVIVTYNTEQLTYNCVKSVLESETNYNYELIVVDNNSVDNTIHRLNKDFPNVNVIAAGENLGFSKGNNVGINQSIGEYVLLLNSDTILLKNSLNDLLQKSIERQYQIVGPILLNTDYSIQRSWFNFPSASKIFIRLIDVYTLFYKFSKTWIFKLYSAGKKPAFMITEIQEDTSMDYLTFACVLIKRNVITKIGNLDEGLFFYQEDCEYGLRAQKNGYKFIYCTDSKIIHLGGSSSGQFSWMAFENDILGLLHIYKKHYTIKKFKQIKHVISAALTIRILGTYFGLYNHLKKSGLYDKGIKNENVKGQMRGKYQILRNTVKNYS